MGNINYIKPIDSVGIKRSLNAAVEIFNGRYGMVIYFEKLVRENFRNGRMCPLLAL